MSSNYIFNREITLSKGSSSKPHSYTEIFVINQNSQFFGKRIAIFYWNNKTINTIIDRITTTNTIGSNDRATNRICLDK